MFGPLIVLIILAPLFLIALFWAFAPYKLYEYHERRLNYVRPGYDHTEEFYNMKHEVRELKEAGREEELATLQKHYKKKEFWYSVWSSSETLCGVIFALICLAIFVFSLWSIVAPYEATVKVVEWEEFATIAEEVFNSSTNEIERAGVVNKMLEYNEWLARARASQKMWGNWSMYYNVTLPDPLLLP